MAIVHGSRGTGKSSVALSLAEAFKNDNLVLSLDFSEVPVDATHEVFWLNMISLVLEAYKSVDQAAAGRCDEFLRESESDASKNRLRGQSTFVSLFDKISKVFKDAEKPVVIIGDEFSRFYDFTDVSEQAKDNVGCALDAFRSIKEGRARGSGRLRGAVLLGTYGAALLRTGSCTVFNVVSRSALPLFTLEEWRACVAQTAWRPEDRVLERMWELTRGHPSVLQTIARDLSTTAITTSAAFEAYEGSSAFLDSVLTNKSVQANLRDLRRPAARDVRASLIKTFLPSESVDTFVSKLCGPAGRLTSLGILRAIDQFSFEVASPLVRRILMERCLPEDFKGSIPFVAPRLKDGRLDVVEMIRLAAPAVVKAAMQSKMTKGPYEPHEVVYHLQLVLHLSAWLEGEAEVKSEVLRGASRTGFNITIVDTSAASPSCGKRVVLELTAHAEDSGDDSIPSHLDRCREIHKPAVSEVYCVHFTSQGETKCFVPGKDDPTPLIHVRHDEEGEVLGLLVKVPGVERLRSVAMEKRKRAME